MAREAVHKDHPLQRHPRRARPAPPRAVVNHEALASCVVKSLTQIADALASVEITAVLYPTEQMKLALAEIYAHMIRFFLRAQEWLMESSWKRALHSVTRPKELRYDDILQDMTAATVHFQRLAVAASQAEQRDIHPQLKQQLTAAAGHQQINASAMYNTNTTLTDLQFSSILNSLTNLPLGDPDKVLQQATFLRSRAALHRKATHDAFWLHPRFQTWSESSSSNLIMVQGTFAGRSTMRACLIDRILDRFVTLIDAIDAIRQANATTLWALKTSDTAAVAPHSGASISSVELLKYLTAQALRLGGPPSTTTERTLALSCARFQTARGEREWIHLLAGSLANMGSRHVFIVVDVELLGREAAAGITQSNENHGSSSDRFTLPESLKGLFAQLEARAPGVVVKVLLVSYGSPLFRATGEVCQKDVLLAGRPRPQRSRVAGRAAHGALGIRRGQLRRKFGL
ncbi:hypothetical protein F5144DRAFT_595385 [Chaetomium tenue]|uniref:Uncharacterized protein n=1 Tax=Chaetomium tenue TaxID=1854479 RepID=A0ACB7NZR4_9PEZI|nr:hypothetical protein F5144DRAFT_595385 [Chaetomium globosum]